MGKRTVIWTKRAEDELKNVLEFYIERNQSNYYSLKLIEEVEKVTKLISSFPLMGRISNNGKTRVLVKNKFLIFYEVYTNAIAIMSFWDGRQNPEKRMDS
jgi:plasmid stabilization system protein ParE